jgi:hypothetical protein
MSDATSVLFGLEDEFTVLDVQRVHDHIVKVVVEQAAREGPCPACGVLTGLVKDRPMMQLKDLPASGQMVQLWWRKRRLVCREVLCPRKTFTQVLDGGAATRPGDRAAAPAGRGGDRGREPGRVGGRRRVQGVRGRRRTRHWSRRRCGSCPSRRRRPAWGSTRPASGRSAGSSTASPGNAQTRG